MGAATIRRAPCRNLKETMDLQNSFFPATRSDLDAMFNDVVLFAEGSKVPLGFGYLGCDGQVLSDRPVELWITCRMTHVFSLAAMKGLPGAAALARHGVHCLASYFEDPIYGGWFSAIEQRLGEDGNAVPLDGPKEAYAHAFVILASNSAAEAGIEGAAELLERALADQKVHWWREEDGHVVEAWNRSFTECEDYRGINSNMHTVEAYLAAADSTGNEELATNALRVCSFVFRQARAHSWRIPEHYDTEWLTIPTYNLDDPAHPFRPFGVTPGHGLEWSRLMLHARGTAKSFGWEAPAWLFEGAVNLFNRAVADAWGIGGRPGFIYTTDLNGRPVVEARMHWVAAEGIGAAVVLQKVLDEEAGTLPTYLDNSFVRDRLARNLQAWWDYYLECYLDSPGAWFHELDRANQVSTRTWDGKPDAYHVSQMLLLPGLPSSPTFAAAIRAQVEASTAAEG